MAEDALIGIWEKAIARSRAQPVSLGKHTSTVVGVRFTNEEAAAIRKIAKDTRIQGTASELIRAVTLALSYNDPEAAMGLLAVHVVAKDDEAKAKAPARLARQPLTKLERQWCQKHGVSEADFFRRVDKVTAARKAKAKAKAQLSRAPRTPLTPAEREWCKANRVTEAEFLARASTRIKGVHRS